MAVAANNNNGSWWNEHGQNLKEKNIWMPYSLNLQLTYIHQRVILFLFSSLHIQTEWVYFICFFVVVVNVCFLFSPLTCNLLINLQVNEFVFAFFLFMLFVAKHSRNVDHCKRENLCSPKKKCARDISLYLYSIYVFHRKMNWNGWLYSIFFFQIHEKYQFMACNTHLYRVLLDLRSIRIRIRVVVVVYSTA